ncbi:MAG: sigma-70 family RNA polymerase sigma factor [Spirochaetota bacterium]
MSENAGTRSDDRDAGALPDEAIIEKVLDGDVEAFSELVKRHRLRVYRVGLSWFHDREEAEDLVQDVFVKAFTKLASFRGASLFSTWLLRIAYNTATSRKALRREHEDLDDDRAVDLRSGVEAGAVADESARELREAMRHLSPEQSMCVELCFFQDLPYAEIAKVTGFPVNTVKSHVFRAKRILRERLASAMEA